MPRQCKQAKATSFRNFGRDATRCVVGQTPLVYNLSSNSYSLFRIFSDLPD
jgi:hypothetical protein